MSTGPAQYFFHSDPLVLADAVIVGADAAGGGGIHAVERSTGRQRWMHPAGRGVPGSIAGAGQFAYAIGSEGKVLAVNVRSGALQWSFPLDVWGWLAPAVSAGRVFVGGRDSVVYALDAETGRIAWRTPLGAPVRTSAVVTTTGMYVGTNDGSVFRLDPRNGAVKASLMLDAKLGPRDLVATTNSLVVLLADTAEDNRALVSVDFALNEVRWRETTHRPWSTTRVFVSNGAAVLGSPAGEVVAYCVADGRKAWSRRVTGTVRAIGGLEDVLYVGTTQGDLYALPARPLCNAE